MVTVRQQTVLELDPAAIRRIFWSVERWDALSALGSDANRGFVRHGVETPTDANLKPYKVPYGEHVQRYLDATGDPTGERPRALLVFGARNTFQNLGLPGWSRGESPTLLHRCDEPYASWIYQGLCVPRHTDRAARPAIASMSFVVDPEVSRVYIVRCKRPWLIS